jgi:tetratricopeptide (TPR) repeat protein
MSWSYAAIASALLVATPLGFGAVMRAQPKTTPIESASKSARTRLREISELHRVMSAEEEEIVQHGLDSTDAVVRGIAACIRRDFDKARTAAQAAVAQLPDDVEAFELLALINNRQGDLDGEIAAMARVVEKRPDDPGSVFGYSKCLARRHAGTPPNDDLSLARVMFDRWKSLIEKEDDGGGSSMGHVLGEVTFLVHTGREAEAIAKVCQTAPIVRSSWTRSDDGLWNAIAVLQLFKGADAEEDLQQFTVDLLRDARASPGPDERWLARALTLRGMALLFNSKLGPALERLREAVALFEAHHDQSFDAAATLQMAGFAAVVDGDNQEARTLVTRSLEIQRKLDGNLPSAQLARTLDSMGGVLAKDEKWGDAEPFFREALDIRRHIPSMSANDLAGSLTQLATNLHYLSLSADAEPLLREALSILRNEPSPAPELLQEVVIKLAIILGNAKKGGEAEPLFREGVALARRLSPSTDKTAHALARYARFLHRDGQDREALRFAEEAVNLAKPSEDDNSIERSPKLYREYQATLEEIRAELRK